jgi:hypothetical protein
VYPLEDFPPNQYTGQSAPTQRVEWGDEQQLAAGYISSRTIAQFVAIRSHATNAELVVVESAADKSPRVQNKLGASIHQLLLSDSQGNWHWGEKIEAGADAQLASIDQKNAQATFSALVRKHQPTGETGIDYRYDSRRRYGWYNNVDANQPTVITATSIMEIALQSYATNGNIKLPPRSYVAITSLPPEVPLGVRKVKMEASFHVVTGQW